MKGNLDPNIEQVSEVFEPIFNTNYRYVLKNAAYFLPLLTTDAKVINVGSIYGYPH